MKNKSFPPKEKEQKEDDTRMDDGDSEEETGKECSGYRTPRPGRASDPSYDQYLNGSQLGSFSS